MQYELMPLPKKRSKRKRLAVTSTLLLVITFAGMTATWALSRNSAAIAAANSNAGVVQQLPDKLYNGKYVSFNYKSGYVLKQLLVRQPDMEQAILRADTSYEKLLTVSVQPMVLGGIPADSGYYFRESHPNLYYSHQVAVGSSTAIEWIRYDGSEQTLYIPHGNEYAVLAFSISNTNDTSGLPDEVSALLQTFQWK